MKLRSTTRYVHQLLVIAIILSSGMIPSTITHFAKRAVAQFEPTATKSQVSITANGFSPSQVTIQAGNEIEWINNSGGTVVLQSGTPAATGQRIYLPLVQRNPAVTENSETSSTEDQESQESQPLPQGAETTVTLNPGQKYSQVFSTVGEFPFYLSNAPQFLSKIIVTQSATPTPTQPPPTPTPTATKLPNSAPQLAAIGNRELSLGNVITFTISAVDPENDIINFSAEPLPLPNNATLDAKSGRFSFKPESAKAYVITFTATDSKGNRDSETVTITAKAAASGGITSLRGRVLDTNDFTKGTVTPIVNAKISLLDTEAVTKTDANGYFVLNNIPFGAQLLDIDTSTAKAAPDGSPYAGFREEINLIAGVLNVVDRPFYLPRIAKDSLTTVNPNQNTTVSNSSLKISLVVPPNTARADDGELFTGKLSISPVPENLAPAALPAELSPATLITIQPVGVTFDQPIPLTFPNSDNLPPGTETDIWSLDPELGAFVIVGTGKVSADGKWINTISGGVRAADWHLTLPPQPDPNDPDNNDNQDPDKCCDAASGSATALMNGNLEVDHDVVGYQSLGVDRSLHLVYNSTRADPQPVVGSNVTIPSRSAVPDMLSAKISVSGVQQGSQVYVNTSGLDESTDESVHQAVQFDASNMPTGMYPYRLSLTSHFGQSAVSSVQAGRVLVNNMQESEFGAGWGLDGYYRLHEVYSGDLLLTEGNGGATLFNRRRAAGELLSATAAYGVPANRDLPSANIGQTIAIFSDPPVFTVDTNVFFTTINDNGVVGTRSIRVESVAEDGKSALVVVPDDATTGSVYAEIGREAFLQIVPRLTTFSSDSFAANAYLYLTGSGFAEAKTTVSFGSASFVDSDPNAGINVYNANTNLELQVPLGATGVVTVSTDGGTSEVLVVGPSLFSGIVATATIGTPANAGQPSANSNQLITILGAGLNHNTNVIFPNRDDNGVAGSTAVRVQSANGDGTAASVAVPEGAVTGDVSLFGTSAKVRLQIVPTIDSFSNSDFFPSGNSRNLQITGHGFAEGNTNFLFGATTVADPDTGPNNVDVFYSGTYANAIIPNGAQGSLRVQTAGGTSNAFPVGPTTFTGIAATAEIGTPAAAGQPAANIGQEITLIGANFTPNTNVIFPVKDDNGVQSTVNVRIKNVAPDGTWATVEPPQGAVTGNISVFGVSSAINLQIVPVLNSHSLYDFLPSGTSRNLTFYGNGFVEGNHKVKFGDVTTTDPDTGPNTVDVYSSGTAFNTIIPNNAKGTVQVTTNGGTSNALVVGPTAFTGVNAVAASGVPSTTSQPSANVGQTIVIYGANLNANSNVYFPALDDNGVAVTTPARVSAVAADGASANVQVPNGAVSGNITLFGATGSFRLQIVPTLTSYSLGDFQPSGTSRNLTMYGNGFAEGKFTVLFGDVPVVDPNTGSATIDVYSSGTAFNTIIPNNAKSSITVKTEGGVSASLAVGPTSFTGISAQTKLGTAANGAQPSANPQQLITVYGSNMTANTDVLFPTVDDNGVASSTYVRVQSVGAGNTWATVEVPNGAKSGTISLFGATANLPLQIVPALSGFSYSDFSAGNNLTLYGGGFIEGGTTVKFGSTSVVDPSTGTNILDVFWTGTGMNVTIPASPGPAITVQTAGGTSNAQHATEPNITLLTPQNSETLPIGLDLTLSALASDNSGVAYVDFLINGSVVVSDTGAPYEVPYTPASIGPLIVGARVRAIDGGTSIQTVTVSAVEPTLTISATASEGTPSNNVQPSANGGQWITIISQKFDSLSEVVFPMVNTEGAPYTQTVRVSNLSADGTWASVVVPHGAVTGDLQLLGTNATARLQIVPTLDSFSLGDFQPSGTSRNLALRGSGFAEGNISLLFGDVTLDDPDIGPETIDVYYGDNSGLSSIVPDNAKGDLRVQTEGGMSNILYVGATTFSGLRGLAALGTPANAGQPSANVGQRITVSGTHFNAATNVLFTMINAEGVEATAYVRVENVDADGTSATVVVPQGAKTGNVSVAGASGSVTLQIVPMLTSFDNYQFVPSGDSRNLTLRGGGFEEGAITVHYGTVAVVDPDAGYNTLDVYNYSDYLNVIIPDNAQGNVSVTTAGGTSNELRVGPTSFASIQSTATLGTPAASNQPSANVDQFITINGVNLTENSSLLFPTVNNDGVNESVYVRVSSVSADRTRAAVQVPNGAATGNLSLFGATGSVRLQIVPMLQRYYNADFVPSGDARTMQLEGNGFVEGLSSVTFGEVVQSDPDAGENMIDVWSAGQLLYTVIPDNAKGLVYVTTEGGVSNQLAVGPTAFTGIQAVTEQGEPANSGQASANVRQLITLRGENLNANTVVIFPILDDNGVPATQSVRVAGTSADGRSATVEVPYAATTGDLQIGGVGGAFRLQIVPLIDNFSYSSFDAGNTLYLDGLGFVEGSNNIRFGSTLVNDPDTGPNLVDSWGSGTRLYVTIPNGAQSRLRVSTDGGTSNSIEVAPPVAPIEYPKATEAPSGPRIFVAPDGDFSTIVENSDGTFTRTTKDGTKYLFNATGLQTATTDRNGNTTTFGYDGSLRLTSITDPVGQKTTFAYANNRISTITDPTNRVTKLGYDGIGNLVSITDPDNSTRYFGYDARHRMTSQTSKRGFVTQYQYNFAGMHVKSVWPDGSTRVITPAMSIGLVNLASGIGSAANPAPVTRPEQMVAKFQDGNGGVTLYKTDRYGAGTEAVDPLGRRVVTTRDEHGNPIQTTQPNGAVIGYTFDAKGNMLNVREGVGTALERTRAFEYDPVFNLVTKITDAGGFATTIEHDAKGNVTKITDPNNGSKSFTYNNRGQVLTIVDELGRTTTFTYDAKGNPQTVVDPLGVVTEIERNAAGEIIGLIQAKGGALQRKTTSAYDAMNRRLSMTDAAGSVETYVYDAEGNLVESKLPTGETYKNEYDAVNRTSKTISPIEGTTQFFYDGAGNIVRMVDATGATTFMRYDAVNRPVQITDPISGTLRFTYDVQDNLLSSEDARGKITRYEYDILDRQTKVTNPLLQSYSFTYDLRDLVLTTVDPKAQTIKYTYDALARRLKIEPPNDVVTFAYDAVGNLLSAQDGDSKVEFAYDAINRPIQDRTTDLGGQPTTTITRTYDALGRRVSVGDSAGGVTQYSYNNLDYLTKIQPSLGGAITALYDASGRPTKVTFANAAITNYGYDANGRLQSLTHTKNDSSSIFANSFEYNAVSNVTKIIEGAIQRQFSYDPLQRVVSGGATTSPESYSYDAVGNRTASFLSVLHQVDDANRLLEDDQFSYTYDATGNLASNTRKSDNSQTTLTFNAFDQLTAINGANGLAVSYRYDALGRRIEKKVGGQITRYVYDGAQIRLEFNGANQLSARFTHGDGMDEVLAMERGGAVYYYLTDRLGSVRKVVNDSGNAVNSYEYDSYGRRTATQETVANPFSFTGREYDAESGNYYYRARYYDPQTGRFISEDPLGLAGGDPNLYSYVRNNPVNSVDPSGLFSFWDALDVISFGLSLYDFIKCPSLGNGLNLALDTIGLLPLVPGIGTVRRGLDAADALRNADRVGDAVRRADDAGDALRHANDVPCSFTPDTLVTTLHGLIPIAEVKEGDYVLAYHEETGKFDYYPVSAAMSKEDPVLIVLTLQDEDGSETVVTTPIHPFYTVAATSGIMDDRLGTWTLAGGLKPGDQILQADGTTGFVQHVATLYTARVMFDLTVADAHSFVVGEEQWLVHNCPVKPGTSGGERAGKDFTPKGKQEVINENAAANGGQTKCEQCGVNTVPSQKSQSGVTPPSNETQVDHIIPKSKGGDGSPSNGQVLCRHCNRQKSDK